MWIVLPPPSNLTRCLEKLRRGKANLVMICPVWPSQPWFPVFLELTCNVPIPSHDLLKWATSETRPVLLTNAHQLATWRLSGEISDGRIFLSRLSSISESISAPLRTRHTNQPGDIGMISLFEETKVPWRLYFQVIINLNFFSSQLESKRDAEKTSRTACQIILEREM